MTPPLKKRNSPRSHATTRFIGLMATLLFTTQAGVAATVTAPTLEGGFAWSADVMSSDFRQDTLDVSGNVRATQGASSIEAQKARARGMRAETQRWTFEDSVRIRTAEADLQSNLATAAIVNGQIENARIEGAPARFTQVNSTPNRQVRGRAGVIEYDFGTGVVKLSNQVWFSNGKDEFRGDVVIYNIRDERVQVNPGGSNNRVRGIIRPNQNKSGAKTQNSGSGSSGGTATIVEPAFDAEAPLQGPKQQVVTDGGGA